MRRVLTLALATAATLAVATPASASLMYDPAATALIGQGFGNVPRSLTVQSTGSDKTPATEDGCIGVSSTGTLTAGAGSCMTSTQAANATHPAATGGVAPTGDLNGTFNTGGDETNPFGFPKQAIPTVADLGWTTASDIRILFNATDPAGNGVDVVDLTLKFYSATGDLLGAIDGSYNFSGTETGTGSAGFIFDVSPDEYAYVNSILGTGGTIYTALETTITGGEGGSESYTILAANARPVPEAATWAMMLVGFGGIGMAMRRRRASRGELLQIA